MVGGARRKQHINRLSGMRNAAAMSDAHIPHSATALEPGCRVRHPTRPDWGAGQVQSVVGDRVTVNFENAGKVLVNARLIALELLND
jgi:hypothetical protein